MYHFHETWTPLLGVKQEAYGRYSKLDFLSSLGEFSCISNVLDGDFVPSML